MKTENGIFTCLVYLLQETGSHAFDISARSKINNACKNDEFEMFSVWSKQKLLKVTKQMLRKLFALVGTSSA